MAKKKASRSKNSNTSKGPKEAATTKQSGGGGFSFEDQVAAYYLALMLAGRSPVNEQIGSIRKVSFQNKSDGWLLDDLLLTLSNDTGESRMALSLKSNQQITSSGFPADFVGCVRKQWKHANSTVFNRSKDYLGIVVGTIPQTLRQAWHSLLDQVIESEPASLINRLNTGGATNQVQRNLFRSLVCNIDGVTLDEEEAVSLMKRLRVIDMDYEDNPSQQIQESISICKGIIKNGQPEEAKKLWERLIGIAWQNSPSGGTISLEKLIGLLRVDFDLKQYPDYDADYRKLAAFSKAIFEALPDRIGGRATIDRTAEIERFTRDLDNPHVLVLLGPSGTGKSVICKKIASERFNQSLVVWLDGQALDVPTIIELQDKIGLRYSLEQLLPHVSDPDALIIFDNVDSYSQNAIRNATILMQYLQVYDAVAPWNVVISCQTDQWDRLSSEMFVRFSVLQTSFTIEQIDPPSIRQLESIWTQIPSLKSLTQRPEPQKLLQNLKILDIVACNEALAERFSSDRAVGESDLIRWYWESIVRRGSNRFAKSRLMLKLAELEANHFRPTLALTDIDDSEARTLDELVAVGIIRIRDERVSFVHDMFSDWSRQRMLIGDEMPIRAVFDKRISNPRWLRALRLYVLDILEQNSDGLSRWRDAMKSLRPTPDTYNSANDIMLESVIFAVNPLPLLDSLWNDLIANEAELLRRLLQRFLHVATFPNPLFTQGADTNSYSSIINRLPYWPYWIPMLQFLSNHVIEVASKAPFEVAQIANTWLRQTRNDWPLRKDVASIAVCVTRCFLNSKNQRYQENKQGSEAVYRALYAASYELPEEVSSIVLSLCQRSDAKNPDDANTLFETDPYGNLPPAWPDGPHNRIDDDFREVSLKWETMNPLIDSHPRVAGEALLALLIEPPTSNNYRSLLDDDFGTVDIRDWSFPIFFHGPFRHFLWNQPLDGIEMVVRFINFVTDRWEERVISRGDSPKKVTLRLGENERELTGNQDVYHWYRDHMISSHSVSSALMALEWCLYERVARKEPIDDWVDYIFANSKSVALLAVLNALGCRYPDLYTGPLKPLLSVWQFYEWERIFTATSTSQLNLNFSLMSCTSYGEELFEVVKQWHEMPHRKKDVYLVAFEKQFTDQAFCSIFDDLQEHWKSELLSIQEQNPRGGVRWLKKLIDELNPENFVLKEHGDGYLIEFVESDGTRNEREAALERSRNGLRVISFPYKCSKILNTGTLLPADQIEAFWVEFQGIVASLQHYPETKALHSREDIVCGGIAVLMCLHSDWLDERSERLEWCNCIGSP